LDRLEACLRDGGLEEFDMGGLGRTDAGQVGDLLVGEAQLLEISGREFGEALLVEGGL
jgi:hypothetical protein